MARSAILFVICALSLTAGKHDKIKIAHGSNDAVEITATALADSESIQQAIGSDLDNHYILVKVEIVPKNGKPLPVHLDDFLLRTDKDGERTTPFVPTQMVGDAALIVSQTMINGNGAQNEQSGPIWGGMGGGMPRRMGGNGQQMGNTAAVTGAQAKMNSGSKDKGKQDPMLATLKEKMLPEKDTDTPISGLLYFPMEKQKVKDLELFYTTPAGKMDLRFR